MLPKFIDFWYDVVPTITATVCVVATIVWDRMKKRRAGE